MLEKLEDDPENRLRVMTASWAALTEEVVVDVVCKVRRMIWGLGSPSDFDGIPFFGSERFNKQLGSGEGTAPLRKTMPHVVVTSVVAVAVVDVVVVCAGVEPQGFEVLVNPMVLLTREEWQQVQRAAAEPAAASDDGGSYSLPVLEALALDKLKNVPLDLLMLRWLNFQLLKPATHTDDDPTAGWCTVRLCAGVYNW